MKSHLLLCLLALCLSGHFLAAQAIQGQLLDAESGEPVPYASVQLSEPALGTLSNSLGYFSLQVPDSLGIEKVLMQINSFGYAPLQLAVELPTAALEIQLPPQAFTLDAVVIYSVEMSPEEMVRQALKHRKDNYPTESYGLRTFYRHYCQEQGVAGRLIEAAIDLYDEDGYDGWQKKPEKKWGVNLRQLRRSLDFTKISPYRHLPIALFNTLEHDLMSYRNPVLHEMHREKLTYQFQDTTYHNGTVIYVVRAAGRLPRFEYSCDLYISTDDFAILKIEEQRILGYRSSRRVLTYVEHFTTSYQQFQGKYYLQHLLNEGHRNTQFLDSLGQISRRDDHYHHVELMVNQVVPDATPFYGGEPTAEQMAQTSYDPAFWRRYTVLQATPLEQDIEADLAARVSLEEQFANYNQPDRILAIQEQLTEDRLERYLNSYRGQAVLLCFWDKGYVPGVQELLFARKLAKTLEGKSLQGGLIFLACEASEQKWQQTLDRKQMRYLGQHLRLARGLDSPIAQRFGATDSPYFVLLSPNREVILQGSKLPKRSEIETLVEKLAE
ncbi:MAG: carboxypeptidase-like regulatory domain-containing protein [Bacteroidota bacterium]